MTWMLGFTLVGPQPLSADRLARSAALADRIAAALQVSECCVRLVVEVEGHAEAAICKGVDALWTLLEKEDLTAFVESARLGADTDCTSLVREIELARDSVLPAALQTPCATGSRAAPAPDPGALNDCNAVWAGLGHSFESSGAEEKLGTE